MEKNGNKEKGSLKVATGFVELRDYPYLVACFTLNEAEEIDIF